MEFKRGRDPKSSMKLGLLNKREFQTISEAANWMAKFPEVYTDGVIKSWTDINKTNDQPFFDMYSGSFNAENVPMSGIEHYGDFSKLNMVRWIMTHLKVYEVSDGRLPLKSAKQIADLTQKTIQENLIVGISESSDNLDKILSFIRSRVDNMPRIHDYPASETKAWMDAVRDIEKYVKNLKDEKNTGRNNRF